MTWIIGGRKTASHSRRCKGAGQVAKGGRFLLCTTRRCLHIHVRHPDPDYWKGDGDDRRDCARGALRARRAAIPHSVRAPLDKHGHGIQHTKLARVMPVMRVMKTLSDAMTGYLEKTRSVSPARS